ncbi:PD-(D/E)XK nuclease-like domain-containing protein [Pseudonocardia parietis]|uniref:Putative exodeoxyribonuclease 8 PDDEXK-like domain-containing protein n=1 Tax=Pseudonocardia parietis TaxID=570936 RepID=A0ABS4W2P5_9PSEU|nr:PD-(D/E)XK nuclease-like domain-containing protein [Pseudonocardia parietis]MBP2370286.1 hypothetical protein [Pseudonocardia parietis]
MTELPLTAPGVYSMSATDYHADPVAGGSLTSTGARKLLPPSCPRKFKYGRRTDSNAFDVGRAAHTLVLGIGDPIKVIAGDGADPNAWATKTTKAEVAKARTDGYTPLKPNDAATVEAMAAALREDEHAAPLLERREGNPEQTLVWRDTETGVWCRAMIDWLPEAWPGQPLRVVDYKTTGSAEPGSISGSVGSFGYEQQAAWYLDGIRALDLDGGIEPQFTFIFQEKEEPYLVTVVTLDEQALAAGRIRNRKARDIYRRCVDTDTWPGYTTGPIEVSLPAWKAREFDTAWHAGAYDIDPQHSEDVA